MFTDAQIKQLEGLFTRQRIEIQKDIQSSEERVMQKILTEIRDVSDIIKKIVQVSEDHPVRIEALEKTVRISSVS